jgi:hypothetical protein
MAWKFADNKIGGPVVSREIEKLCDEYAEKLVLKF